MPEVTTVAANPHLLEMVFSSGPVVRGVLILLVFLSIFSWAIVIAKVLQLRRVGRESEEFRQLFWDTRNFARIDDSARRLQGSPLAQVFFGGYRELSHVLQDAAGKRALELGTVERALKRAEFEEAKKLDRGLTFLATVASAAPFIGLFGTVWGIMTAFQGLSTAKSTTIQAVAPGISEALVATAIGLAAAIPAAVAFNYFAASVKRSRQSMDSFCQDFLKVAERYVGVEGH